jgi:site-specific DNA recombinase
MTRLWWFSWQARVTELRTIRDQARADAERAEGGGYRRDHLRALAQRVEVDTKEVRIMGSKSALLRTLVAASSAKTAGFGVPGFVCPS